MKQRSLYITLLWMALIVNPVSAEVRLSALFNSHMVLQRDHPVRIWGWADPQEQVQVEFNQEIKRTQAGEDGKWFMAFSPLPVGGPYTMIVRGESNHYVLEDIRMGDVWLCSGQSNMKRGVSKAAHAEQEIKNGNHPLIRFFNVAFGTAPKPAQDVNGTWKTCTPESVGECSAVGYFFARSLTSELSVPIGIINSSWGSTNVETWTSQESIKPDAQHSLLYNAMIDPMTRLGIKGVLWYQGEHNSRNPEDYATLFPALIRDWRSKWGYEFPFYWVQLPNFILSKGIDWAVFREIQSSALALPRTGQAVTIDIGESHDIHPLNKQDVGKRLALIALCHTYGRKDIPCRGPVCKGTKIRGQQIEITFDHIDRGLQTGDGGNEVKGFEVAGHDKKYFPAKAYIAGHKIIVSCDAVGKPVFVRYAWANDPVTNLYNTAGLPAEPFRTDK